tara:strand:- start:255 stop:719 length:465 start_codon:yes stop_codon:yes gene_type:complete
MANISTYPIGTPAAGDLIPGTQLFTDENGKTHNLTKNFTVSQVASFSDATAGYTVYAARLNGGAGAKPTVNLLQNTTGLTLDWARTGSGVYKATITGGTIAQDKFWAQVGAKGTEFPSIIWDTATEVRINNVVCSTGAAVDSITEAYVEIRIYS